MGLRVGRPSNASMTGKNLRSVEIGEGEPRTLLTLVQTPNVPSRSLASRALVERHIRQFLPLVIGSRLGYVTLQAVNG